MWKTRHGFLLVRTGIAFSFLYAAIRGFLNPENWIGWFPPSAFMLWPWSDESLLAVWGIIEVALAVWLLIGWRVDVAGFVAAVLLFGVTVANWSSMDIVFRDIALGLAACGLAVGSRMSRTP